MAEIIRSNVDDNEILTDITKKSKAYWGYSDEQIEKWSELLTIPKNYIETNHVYKLLVDNSTVGYYSYINLAENEVKLDNLFVLPNYIGNCSAPHKLDKKLRKISWIGCQIRNEI